MAAAREAGLTLADFLDLDGIESEAWVKYAVEGPSNIRVQLLLAQILQSICGALGGRSPKVEDLLPYWDEMTDGYQKRRREKLVKQTRHQQASERFLDTIKGKK